MAAPDPPDHDSDLLEVDPDHYTEDAVGGGATESRGRRAQQEPRLLLGSELVARLAAATELDPGNLLGLCKKGDWTTVGAILTSISAGHDCLSHHDKVSGWNALFYAVAANQIMTVSQLVDLHVDLSHRSKDGRNVVHVAAQFAEPEVVRVVLYNFPRNEIMLSGGAENWTPLHFACARTSQPEQVVKSLLKIGRESRLTPDAAGYLPIMVAAEVGNIGVSRELLAVFPTEQTSAINNANGDSILHIACRNKDMEMIRLFCDQGSNTDLQNNEGHTPLHIAAWEGHEQMVRYFYQLNASAHIIDQMDRSPLHIAAERGHTAVVELLIDKFQASVAARTKDGSTLLHIASQCGHPDTALMFLKKGVPLLMPNKAGSVCVHVAATQGHVAVVRALMEMGAAPNTRNKQLLTPLHLAVSNCKPNVVQTLLGFGADVQLSGGALEETPLHLAAKVTNGGERVAEMLIKSGADANACQLNGETPLHVAARCGNLRVLVSLLDDGGDPAIQSNTGDSALHLAVRYCNYRVSKTIIDFTVKEKSHGEALDLINIVNQEGETALHYAAELTTESAHYRGEEVEIKKLLLSFDADIFSSTNLTCETALHYCCRSGNEQILAVLLEKLQSESTILNRQSKNGWSPLAAACEQGHVGIVRMLLHHNARVDLFDERGDTALHLAAENGHADICDELMWNNAFVNARSKLGVTPLHQAAKNGYPQVVKLLVESHKASVDALSLQKRTPLHLAAQNGEIDVCRILLDLNADPTCKDLDGDTPLHLAGEMNHSEVVKLFLNHSPELVSMANNNGCNCAHIAASKGSEAVIRGLLKFNREGVVQDKDHTSGSTPLHLAAAGGFAEVVRVLVEFGGNPLDENDDGYTALHLAARNGHIRVLQVLKTMRTPLKYCSKISGMSAIHVAAYFGQTHFVQELLQDMSATVASAPPCGVDAALQNEIREYGLTPLHLAAQCGHEGLVRLLLNSPGVQPNVQTAIHGTTPLHLAAQEGHSAVIGLLLSKSAGLMHSRDKRGRTGLHMASANGHLDLASLLIGQGADPSVQDNLRWTPLHFAAKAGHLGVVRMLIGAGADPQDETRDKKTPICYAASNNHIHVLMYLMKQRHNSHKLINDPQFIFDLMVCGDSPEDKNKPIRNFVLWSPAPLEIAAKLAHNYADQSSSRKDRAKELFFAAKFCQRLAVDLASVAASPDTTEPLLKSDDLMGVSMLDVLIECEQKEVLAHPSIQKYLSDVWMGQLNIATWKMFIVFLAILFPPGFVFFSIPNRCITLNRVPLVKMLLYLTSHLYFIALLTITVAFRLTGWSDDSDVLLPKWNEWCLVAWFCGMLLSELIHPSDKSGLGIIKIVLIALGCVSIVLHASGYLYSELEDQYNMLYIRNQVLAFCLMLAFVQLLDFLTFHHMFGPWAIILRDLMKDLFRFMILLALFLLGFTLEMAAISQPAYPEPFCTAIGRYPLKDPVNGMNNTYIDGGRVVVEQFERLSFALFGLTDPAAMYETQVCIPIWSVPLTNFMFGFYQVIAMIVLINLLIAMMSDTYQRIQLESDTEWKFGRALLIRSMNNRSPVAPPLNLILRLVIFFFSLVQTRGGTCSVKQLSMADSLAVIGGPQDDDSDTHSTANLKVPGGSRKTSTRLAPSRKTSSRLAPSRKTSSRLPGSTRGSAAAANQVHGGHHERVRVEQVVDWDHVMELYQEMHHIQEDDGDDAKIAEDQMNVDLGGSFQTNNLIESYFSSSIDPV